MKSYDDHQSSRAKPSARWSTAQWVKAGGVGGGGGGGGGVEAVEGGGEGGGGEGGNRWRPLEAPIHGSSLTLVM